MEAGSDYGDSGEEEIVTTDFEYYLNSKAELTMLRLQSILFQARQEVTTVKTAQVCNWKVFTIKMYNWTGPFTVDNGNSSQCKNTKTLCKIVNFDPDSLFLSNATQVLTLKRANGSDVELEVETFLLRTQK